MKKIILSVLLAVGVIVACLVPASFTLTVLSLAAIPAAALFIVANTSRLGRRGSLVAATNTAPANWGTRSGGKQTFLAAAAITTRYKLVKKGADAEHIAIPTATADEPIGVCIDEPAAAEDPVTVLLLGAHEGTIPMVAGGAITDGARLYMGSTGSVVVKPTAAGTYWFVGNAQGAWSTGEVVPVIPSRPRKLIVIAALTSTNGTAAAASASLANLAAEAEKIGDDVRAIAAALDGDSDVALATT